MTNQEKLEKLEEEFKTSRATYLKEKNNLLEEINQTNVSKFTQYIGKWVEITNNDNDINIVKIESIAYDLLACKALIYNFDCIEFDDYNISIICVKEIKELSTNDVIKIANKYLKELLVKNL